MTETRTRNEVLDPELGWVDAVPLAGPRRWPAVLWCWALGWTVKTDHGRGHRPKRVVNGRVWECACGKAAWRDMAKPNLSPGPLFGAIGFRRER